MYLDCNGSRVGAGSKSDVPGAEKVTVAWTAKSTSKQPKLFFYRARGRSRYAVRDWQVGTGRLAFPLTATSFVLKPRYDGRLRFSRTLKNIVFLNVILALNVQEMLSLQLWSS